MVTNFFANGATESSDALLERLRVVTAGLYDVAGEIGRGGMAIVYIATDMRLGRKVAIKVMEPRLSFTPGMAERFLQEARIAARLQHHNIIVVHEVQQNAELIFFVMRLVEGGSLDEICRRLAQRQQQLPLDQAQWILWQSARALSYAHSEGIVHRDVKPANIMVTTKGEVVVTDFGIAKAADGEGLTKSGMAIGTPVYMSPEQFTGVEPVSGAADQYALGIAAYELLAGAPPFAGDLYRLIASHGQTVPPDVRELRPDCPAPLAEAISRMLAKRPADRWPSLEAVLPVFGAGLQIDGSHTRLELASIADELQRARADSVPAWGALTPHTPAWTSGSRTRTPVPSAISISPPNARLVEGGKIDLRAVVRSDSGATIGGVQVTWSSSHPAVATVSAEGAVLAVGPGTTTIRAAVAGAVGSTGAVQTVVEVEVTAAEAARLRIVQGEQSLECGEAMLLTAEVFDEQGQRLPKADVEWSSSAPDVLHVDARGTLMALSGGIATVTARSGSVQGTTRVQVREAPVGAVTLTLARTVVDEGEKVALTLEVTDVSGLPRSASGLAVLSDQPQVATVTADPWQLETHGAGQTRVRVISDMANGGQTSSVREPWAVAVLEVKPVPTAIDVSLAKTRVLAGDATTVLAKIHDRRGESIGGGAVTWRSSDESIATVTASGEVQAHSSGVVSLVATSGGVQGTVSLEVQAIPLASLRIRAAGDGSTFVGGSVPFSMEGTDIRGRTIVPPVRWSVDPASAGRVSASGVVVPSVPGRLTVVATAEQANAVPGQAGAAVEARSGLEVRVPRVLGLQLPQPSVKLRVGGRHPLRADVRTEAGVGPSADVKWTSADDSVARVLPTGELEAVGVGSAAITVRLGAQQAVLAVEVAAARAVRPWVIGGGVALAAVALVVMLSGGASDERVTDDLALAPDAPPVVVGGDPLALAVGESADAGTTAAATAAARADSLAESAASSATGSGETGGGTASGSSGGASVVEQPTSTIKSPVTPPPIAARATPRPTPSTAGRPGGAARADSVAAAARVAAARAAADSALSRSAGVAAEPTPTPAAAEPVQGPNESDMRSLAYEYTARLLSGDARSGTISEFFTNRTSEHKASVVGSARRVSAQANELVAEFTVELDRTMGSGAIQRRYSTVRLVLRGRPGAAVIATATPGPLRNAP